MLPLIAEFLGILSRWIHITSAVVLIGGVAYARVVALPTLAPLDDEERHAAWQSLTHRFTPLIYMTIVGLAVSGVYNLLMHPGHTRLYYISLGLKLLLAAHIFATTLLLGHPVPEPKLARRLTSALLSGLVVLLLAAYLRQIY